MFVEDNNNNALDMEETNKDDDSENNKSSISEHLIARQWRFSRKCHNNTDKWRK